MKQQAIVIGYRACGRLAFVQELAAALCRFERLMRSRASFSSGRGGKNHYNNLFPISRTSPRV